MLTLQPQHDFLVAIDSDGCVFDSMEIKHKECFIPCFIQHFNLQVVSRLARECWEFVNLYSATRGVNRFPALVKSLEWLAQRPEVAARSKRIEIPPALAQWIATETRLGNPALEARVRETGDSALAQCLAWSHDVNRTIDALVRDVPPFPFVRETLAKVAQSCDAIVCSATPTAALEKEWAEHQLTPFVAKICGQELGNKRDILAHAKKYPPGHTLMVGDALGDYAAAVANDCLFFPINPGEEAASWERLFREGLERFLAGQFAGEYQHERLMEFQRLLPEWPAWRR